MSAKTYTFTLNGVEHSIPKFKNIPIGILEDTMDIDNEMKMVFTILRLVLEDKPETLAAIRKLDIEEFQEWQKGWLGEATLGEASGSAS